MRPLINHLGHACIQYNYKGLTVTSDPWFFPAFLYAWFPYPDNKQHLLRARDTDYVYISHAHEDHFDRTFLSMLHPATEVIVPRFRSRYLEVEVEKVLGHRPIVLAHGETAFLPNGLKATMFTDRSHKEDSALLLETPEGHRFLNSNDCELAISDWPRADVLAAQFSGATWYPQCYDYDDNTMLRKIRQVRQSNLDRLCRRLDATQAATYLPSAGPAVFLPPELDHFNHSPNIFTHWEDVKHGVRSRFPDVEFHQYLQPTELLSEYRERRRDQWSLWYREDDSTVTVEELNAHFLRLQQHNKRWMKDYQNDIYLTANNHGWNIKLGLVRGELEESPDPRYFMHMPMRVLRAVVDGRATWETALTSHRVKLHRNPDVYDSKLMGLLNFGDRPIQTTTMAKQQEPNEMTTVLGYEVQRYCPHAGEDLNFATVEDGKITCPRHGWCWDVNTGECLTGQGVPLKVRRTDGGR